MTNLKMEQIKIGDIIPAGYNPRLINEEEYNKLKNSMEKFGLVDPIIVNLKNNHIVGGHQRYDVLLDLLEDEDSKFNGELQLIKLGNVGWVFTNSDLNIKDENHEKTLNLALNKINGDWDYNKLGELIDELASTGLNLELTGFDELELESITLSEVDIDNTINTDEYVPDDLMEDIQGKTPNKKKLVIINCETTNDANTLLNHLGIKKTLDNENININYEDIIF